MPRRRQLVQGIALAGVCTALAGCVPQGLAFRVDDRLTFRSPTDRSTVRLPVTLDWDVEDFQVTGPGGQPREDAGYFAVFVDGTPVPPGKSLRWVARDDRRCRADDGCPDATYLADRGIYPTSETRLVLEQLPRGDDGDVRERHRATVVLLDASGRRIGESAFEIAFDVERGEQ